jgi:hypothetical protein
MHAFCYLVAPASMIIAEPTNSAGSTGVVLGIASCTTTPRAIAQAKGARPEAPVRTALEISVVIRVASSSVRPSAEHPDNRDQLVAQASASWLDEVLKSINRLEWSSFYREIFILKTMLYYDITTVSNERKNLKMVIRSVPYSVCLILSCNKTGSCFSLAEGPPADKGHAVVLVLWAGDP